MQFGKLAYHEINKSTANTQLLKNILSSFGDVGTTEAGRAFCIKALHPSDPTTEVQGVPDQTAFGTVMLNLQQTFSLTTPDPANDTWEGSIYLYSNPAAACTYYTYGLGEDIQVAHGVQPNTTLGATVGEAVDNVLGAFERWRSVYYGATIYLDAPSVANQGSVVSVQYPIAAHVTYPSVTRAVAPDILVGHSIQGVVNYQLEDTPQYETVTQMPNSYSGQFRDGLYVPLKLDSNHAAWHDRRDLVMDESSTTPVDTRTKNLPSSASEIFTGLSPGLESAWMDTTGHFKGDLNFLPSSPLASAVCFTGISKDATVRLVIRSGFEFQPQPGSPYSTFVKQSPGYDRLALDQYFMISRHLKDAYPAEYNDQGKLWDVIKRAASLASPFLGMLPYGSLIREAGVVAGKVGDAIAARAAAGKKASAKRAVLSATDLERSSRGVRR